jgi:hypothetical protein
MTFVEDHFLNLLTHNAPIGLVTIAFLVLFLTHKPRRRGLTLAMIGCALSLLRRSSWLLIAWSNIQHDTWLTWEHWFICLSDGTYVTQLVLWIVALHLLYRDSRQHVADAWYVLVGEKVFGPHSAAKLRQGADLGKLSPDTLVRKREDGEWFPASELTWLFDEFRPVS